MNDDNLQRAIAEAERKAAQLRYLDRLEAAEDYTAFADALRVVAGVCEPWHRYDPDNKACPLCTGRKQVETRLTALMGDE